MKWFLFLIIIIGFSCNGQTNNQAESNGKLQSDSEIALKFINEYVDFSSSNPLEVNEWIKNNKMLTIAFKNAYKSLMDPEMELDFDPILDAQDFPDKGFELVSYDNKTGYVTVRGKGWPEFVLVLKVVNINNKPLVDGSGVINVPENKRGKR